MQTVTDRPKSPKSHRLHVGFARYKEEIAEAQRLRKDVFSSETGAAFPEGELDIDPFDKYCEHLLVRDTRSGKVVGTYRLLTPDGAKNAGRFYSQTEFDLSLISNRLDRTVEVGRSCVDPGYRSGAVISLLWSALARFMSERSYSFLMGCASVPLSEGSAHISEIRHFLRKTAWGRDDMRVRPLIPFPVSDEEPTCLWPPMPPLLKGYLRLGARVLGDPALDAEFGTADFLVFLSFSGINPRYARHFLRESTGGEASISRAVNPDWVGNLA